MFKILSLSPYDIKIIWWLGSSSGAPRSVDYFFIANTPGSTLTCYGSINVSNRCLKNICIR